MTLTPAGAAELRRLTQACLDRFALFVADWQPGDVHTLTALLDKLRNSMAAVAAPSGSSARPSLGRRPTTAVAGLTGPLPTAVRLRAHPARRDRTAIWCGTKGQKSPAGDWRQIGGVGVRSPRLRLSLSVTAWMAPPRPGFAPVPVGLVCWRSRIVVQLPVEAAFTGAFPAGAGDQGHRGMTSGSYPQRLLPGPCRAVGAMGADERLSRSVPRRLFDPFEKLSLPGPRPRPSRWCMKWPPRDLFLFKRELPLLSIQPH